MLITQLYLALLGLIFASLVAGLLGMEVTVWHLYIFTFMIGAGWAMNNPTRQTLVANSVPREEMIGAIAMNSAAYQITRIIGPTIGGVLIATVGPATNFFIQAAAFVGVFLLVLPLRIPQENFSASQGQSFMTNNKEGVIYSIKKPLIF